MGDGIQKSYAIVINGDTEDRHLGNVDRAVEALQTEGIDEVYVLSPQPPQGSVTGYATADSKSLQRVTKGLASYVDDDDYFIVYSTGHGGFDAQNRECTALTDGCYPLASMKQDIDRLKFGSRAIIMDGCMSGAGLTLFANPKTSILTLGSPGEAVSCHTFSPFFWSPAVPDANQDGTVTLQERFTYALAQKQTLTHPQFYPAEENFGISGRVAAQAPFPAEVVEVHDGASLAEQLKRLGPGELALVDFSADWCQPCKAYEPKFQQLAREYKGRFLMIRAEGVHDSEQDWAHQYGVSTLPTVAFVNSEGRVRPVADKEQPVDSLLAAIETDAETLQKQFLSGILSSDPLLRYMAVSRVEMLGKEGDFAIGFLVIMLLDSASLVSDKAFQALGKREPFPGFLESLFWRWLETGDDRRQQFAREKIGIMAEDSPRLLKKILQKLKSVDVEEKVEGLKILLEVGEGPRNPIAKSIFPLLTDPDARVRRVAIQAIKRFAYRFPEAMRAYLRLARDPDAGVRAEVANALGSFNTQPRAGQVMPVLEGLLLDSDLKVQDSAAGSLGYYAHLSDHAFPRLWAIEIERRHAKAQFPWSFLGSEGPIEVQSTLSSLAFYSEKIRAGLLETVRNSQADAFERALAVDLLGSLGLPKTHF
jgi:thiol-disulfide isomerase/thioredoxin